MNTPEDPYHEAISEEHAHQLLGADGLIFVYKIENFLARQAPAPHLPRLVPYQITPPFMDAPVFVASKPVRSTKATEESIEYEKFPSGLRRLGNFVLNSFAGNKTVCAALCTVVGTFGLRSAHVPIQATESQPSVTLVHDGHA